MMKIIRDMPILFHMEQIVLLDVAMIITPLAIKS